MTDTKTEVPDVLAMMNAALADIHTEHPDTIPCPAPDRLDAMSEEELVIECWRWVKQRQEAGETAIFNFCNYSGRSHSAMLSYGTPGPYHGYGPTSRDALLDVLRQVNEEKP